MKSWYQPLYCHPPNNHLILEHSSHFFMPFLLWYFWVFTPTDFFQVVLQDSTPPTPRHMANSGCLQLVHWFPTQNQSPILTPGPGHTPNSPPTSNRFIVLEVRKIALIQTNTLMCLTIGFFLIIIQSSSHRCARLAFPHRHRYQWTNLHHSNPTDTKSFLPNCFQTLSINYDTSCITLHFSC